MLNFASKMVPIEEALGKQLFLGGVFNRKEATKHQIRTPLAHLMWTNKNEIMRCAVYGRKMVKVYAGRRRRIHTDGETFVLLEPGEDEKFVTEEELRVKLKGWLENWPAKNLPQDLARFESIDDAVTYLVRSVCELEIHGNVGSVQWYEVRLE